MHNVFRGARDGRRAKRRKTGTGILFGSMKRCLSHVFRITRINKGNRPLAILGLIVVLAGQVFAAETIELDGPEGLFFDARDHLYIADTGNHRVLELDAELTLVRVIGKKGGGNGEFRRPADVAVDSTGRLIVADTNNQRVQILDAQGAFVLAFGSRGKADGQFERPTNVTVDERDNIIVTDRFNNRLQVFDREGRHLFSLANRTGTKTPERIALERKWQLERDPGKRPEQITINPEWQKTDPGQLNEPGGTWLDVEAGELWVANGWNCRSERLDYDSATGRITRKPNEGHDGIVWGPWVTRNCTGTPDGGYIQLQSVWGRLQLFHDRRQLNALSKIDRVIAPGAYGPMKGIFDIVINSKGEVAVADTRHSRIVVFDKDFSVPSSPSVPYLTRDGGKIVPPDAGHRHGLGDDFADQLGVTSRGHLGDDAAEARMQLVLR